ncbi:hypothetical protein C8R44DRAFT_729059 [Mycena epipterygia]|nr:hypothetical protein C8R44DRAFT_729059 [Mycena epipterygia]
MADYMLKFRSEYSVYDEDFRPRTFHRLEKSQNSASASILVVVKRKGDHEVEGERSSKRTKPNPMGKEEGRSGRRGRAAFEANEESSSDVISSNKKSDGNREKSIAYGKEASPNPAKTDKVEMRAIHARVHRGAPGSGRAYWSACVRGHHFVIQTGAENTVVLGDDRPSAAQCCLVLGEILCSAVKH